MVALVLRECEGRGVVKCVLVYIYIYMWFGWFDCGFVAVWDGLLDAWDVSMDLVFPDHIVLTGRT